MLIEPFASYPINIHGITVVEQWKNIADTLNSYIVANDVRAYRETLTDESGRAVFEGLQTGLYLISEASAENNSGSYIFNRFLVYLPTPEPDGSFNYDVEANPKCISYVPKTEYRVTKLWQDTGVRGDRPEQITIDIYKDGVLYDTQTLSADNNWSYVWYVSGEEQSAWTVAERSASDKYTVTIQQGDGHFSIINTHKSTSDKPDSPDTGDTASLLPYVLIMCISGIALILTGIYKGKRRGV